MSASESRCACETTHMSTPRTRTRPYLIALALGPVAALLASCAPMGPPRTSTVDSVDVTRYSGTWYEVASVKQFFSLGLVNTTANYQLNPDGSIRVENAGRYFASNGPESRIVGNARAVDASNARLNVSFVGNASSDPPGNYWIVDLDPDYQWAVVSDPTGTSCFILTRTPTISDELRSDLLARAAAKGVDISNVTVTPQS